MALKNSLISWLGCWQLLVSDRVALAAWPETTVTSSYKDNFPSFGAMFGKGEDQYDGYDWTAYTTWTIDEEGEREWELNFFRLEAKEDRIVCSGCDRREDSQVELNSQNVLLMHGMGQDAETWMKGYFVGTPLPLKLVDEGYNVFMGNNRGTKFSKNLKVTDKTDEAYWDFDFREMGTEDIPSIIHSINDIVGGSVIYVGYDMGNT